MKAIKIPPITPEIARRMEEANRKASEFLRECEESRAAYIERNGIKPEEEYQLNYYPYHAFTDI